MLGRRKLSVILGAAGALALLLGGLGGLSTFSAQEATPQSEDVPLAGIAGRGLGLFDFGRGGEGTIFDSAADVLGMTAEELFSELHAGSTIDEVAEARNVEMEDLQEAMSAAREEAHRDAIAQSVEAVRMSPGQADWLLEGLEQSFMPGRGFGHGFRGDGMTGGLGGFAPEGSIFEHGQSDTSTPRALGSSSL